MEIRAAEISAIIKQQIASFGTEAEVAEVGTVLSVGDGIARVYGLDQVMAGDAVDRVAVGEGERAVVEFELGGGGGGCRQQYQTQYAIARPNR